MPKRASPVPSDKQLDVLKFIISYVEENGFQPSLLEIAQHFDITRAAVADRLNSLFRRGFIEYPDKKDRAIRIKFVRFKAVFEKGE